MFGYLLNVLIELLPINSDQFPGSVWRMTIQCTLGIVSEIFVISSTGIVGIDVLEELSERVMQGTGDAGRKEGGTKE